MTRRLAGLFGRRPGSGAAERIRRAFDSDGSTLEDGPLNLRFSGGPPGSAGSILCLVDGAIHDTDELAAEIGRPGTDPETVLAVGWSRWGEAMFERLRGEWNVVLWDRQRQRGLAACDRLSSRTVHYFRDPNGVVFGSEVRDVISLLPSRPPVDDAALSHWLAGWGPPAGRTLYEGIRRLPGGHLLSFGPDGVAIAPWWRPRYLPPLRRSRPELVHELRGRLQTSLSRCRTESGVAGVLLSGGLDSGSVAALLTDGGARRGERAYSAVFRRHPSVDESRLIDGLADRLGLRSVRVEADVGPLLAGAVSYLRDWEAPPTSPNLFFWLPLLRRAADDGIATLLDGEGGDELFGAARYLLADQVRSGRPLAAWRLARRFPGAGDRPRLRPLLAVTRDYAVLGALPWRLHALGRRLRDPARHAPRWFLPRTARSYADSDDPWAWLKGDGPRWWLGLLESLTSKNGAVLARDHVRCRSAMVGIEPRHPLLDADVIELILQVEPRHAFDPHLSRTLLRDAVQGLLPDDVRLRPDKSNFDTIFHRSLTGPEARPIRQLLTAPDAELRRYVDPGELSAFLSEQGVREAGGPQRWSLLIWRLATAELFLRAQADPDLPARLTGREALPDLPMVERAR